MPQLTRTVADITKVPEAYRSLYVENEAGGWTIDVEGVEDVSELKATMKKLRAHESLALKYKELFPDKSPAEVLELVKAAEKAGDKSGKGGKGGKDDDDADRIIEKRTAEATKRAEEAEARATAAEKQLRDSAISSVAKSAFLKAKGITDSADDAVELSRKHFDVRDGKVVVLDEDGDPTSMSPEKFFATKFKEKRSYLFQGTGASGSGATGSSGKGNAGVTDAPSTPIGKIAAGLAAQAR